MSFSIFLNTGIMSLSNQQKKPWAYKSIISSGLRLSYKVGTRWLLLLFTSSRRNAPSIQNAGVSIARTTALDIHKIQSVREITAPKRTEKEYINAEDARRTPRLRGLQYIARAATSTSWSRLRAQQLQRQTSGQVEGCLCPVQ